MMTTPQRLYDAALLDYEGARAELEAAIKRLGYAEGFEAGREFEREDREHIKLGDHYTALYKAYEDETLIDDVTDAIAESFVSAPPKKTAQELRDEIVERAKADVDELLNVFDTHGVVVYGAKICRTEIIVNPKNRMVTTLLRGTFTNNVHARGIAKCAPNDCFNVHIGKAIALRRALGLDVPDEYLNAPKPTEVRVGDYVDLGAPYDRELVSATEHNDSRHLIGLNCAELWNAKGQARIIDDSREEAVE